jgi:hypothetical protein
VSAAVSDESVAGDSGVFEASNKKRSSLTSDNAAGLEDMNLETAQVQIKLRYVPACTAVTYEHTPDPETLILCYYQPFTAVCLLVCILDRRKYIHSFM